MAEATKPKSSVSTFKLILIIVILCLVPLVLQQLKQNPETVKIVGRACVGIGAAFLAYGVFTKMLKVLSFLVIAVLVFAVLAAEGVIELPNLLER